MNSCTNYAVDKQEDDNQFGSYAIPFESIQCLIFLADSALNLYWESGSSAAIHVLGAHEDDEPYDPFAALNKSIPSLISFAILIQKLFSNIYVPLIPQISSHI